MSDSHYSGLLVDGMLGRLAKWLRIMGYDTSYDPGLDDNELVRRSRAENRLLLTRDHELAGRPGVRSLLIHSGELPEQLRQVRSRLSRPLGGPFSRCPVCNAVLADVSRREVEERVPPYVLRTQHRFRRCPSCDRIYWRGTHWRRMQKRLLDLGEAQGPTVEALSLRRHRCGRDGDNREGESAGPD